MKMNILDKIDSYYLKKGKKEFLYTVLALVLAVGFIIFYFITPDISSFKEKNEKNFQKFTIDLRENLMMLNGFKAQNIRIQRELKNMKKHLIVLNKDEVFYSQLINLLDFAKFNKYDWAFFVKNSIIDAKNLGLDVESVKNQFIKDTVLKKIDSEIRNLNNEINNIEDATFFVDDKAKAYYLKKMFELRNKISKLKEEKNKVIQRYTQKLINPKMLFSLTLKGKYKDFIYFMYQYENIKPLIKVDNFKIEAPDKYYIEFHLYGYTL